MKKTYCIGFFMALFVFVSLLGIGYKLSVCDGQAEDAAGRRAKKKCCRKRNGRKK